MGRRKASQAMGFIVTALSGKYLWEIGIGTTCDGGRSVALVDES